MNATHAQTHGGSMRSADGLPIEEVDCPLCGRDDAEPIAVGEDFEYHTTRDTWRMVRCRRCRLLYLNPRPARAALDDIYPASYHAFDFEPERFGLIHAVRTRLEARRLRRWCRGLPKSARILDVGCGDGFHLQVLRRHGRPGWQLEGVDPSEQAVEAARAAGLTVHEGTVEAVGLPPARYDLALMIMTIEHVPDPPATLEAVRRLLKPRGRLIVVTDNADTLDFRVFRRRHWGGYHFPRHFHLFDARTLGAVAEAAGFGVRRMQTAVSPVNAVYSLRNLLVDLGAPPGLYERLALDAPVGLGVFTVVDAVQAAFGHGSVLTATLERPARGHVVRGRFGGAA